jgi:cbb3-type cytochrome oxidase maturation protein
MNVLVYLIPMALALGITALLAFFWSVRTNQYEDMEGAALRVLSDDDVENVSGHGRSEGAEDQRVGQIFKSSFRT